MPTQHNRKPTRKHPHRKPLKARRTAAGRFTGKPAKGETLSETVMPDEYAPGAEPPREQPWAPDPVVVTALAGPSPRCLALRDGFRCTLVDGHDGAHQGRSWSGAGTLVWARGEEATTNAGAGYAAENPDKCWQDLRARVARGRPWYRRLLDWLR